MRQGIFGYFLRNIVVKHRLSIRDNDDREMYYTDFSVMRFILWLLAVVFVVFVGTLCLGAFTPILDIFPGFVGHKSKDVMVQNLTKLDSLSMEIADMAEYVDNISMVLEGKSPVMRTAADAISREEADLALVTPSLADSLLRAQMEGEGRYGLNRDNEEPRVRRELELLPPLKGEVVEKFDAVAGQYGTVVRVDGIKQVSAIQSGTVILALWSPEDGNVLQIQHTSGFVATYKNMSQVFKTAGDKVVAGEVLGSIWVEDASTDFEFELWSNGQPMDAQNYITF